MKRAVPRVPANDPRKPLWRTLSYHCGDPFADWVCDVADRRTSPMDFLKACVVVVEANEDYGTDARRAVAEMCLPDVWDEEQFKITDYFYHKRLQ